MSDDVTPTTTPKTLNKPARRSRARAEKPLKYDNGKAGRRTPAQLERQERVYDLSVCDLKTVRQIAKLEKISAPTVLADLKHEFERRAAEREKNRPNDLQVALSTYESIARRAIRKSELYDTLLEERDGAKISDHSLEALLKARERVDKLLGLESPTKIDLGLQTLIEALEPK